VTFLIVTELPIKNFKDMAAYGGNKFFSFKSKHGLIQAGKEDAIKLVLM
jgi:hypothetical protein